MNEEDKKYNFPILFCERVMQKVRGWKAKFMSQVGKEILVKVVLQAILAYIMYVFKIPLAIIRRLEQWLETFGGHKI